MGTISDESIRKVLEATDIVDLVNAYVPLKRAGSAWKGVCPFHNDTRPSMTVNPNRQSFMCFACQTGGDALAFVMKYENVGFVDAVRKLADRAGIVLVEENRDPGAERLRKRVKSLVEVNRMAADYFHELLRKSPDAHVAREYLNGRGYGADMAGRWSVGWSPRESSVFLKWARSRSIPDEALVEAGLASRDERGRLYARFRDRLMFPIHNDRGECVGFSGRLLREAENTGKYVNTPETVLFKKSQLCFGLDKAQRAIRDSRCVLVCEGQMDVIACHEAGFDYAVASLGTAFTHEHARLLKRRTDRVILCFDADAAGVKASDRAFRELAAEGADVLIASLPSGPDGKGDDPDSFIKREGAEAFRHLIDEARPFIEARIEWGRRSGRMGNASDAAALAREVADLVSSVKDPVARDLMASDAATRLQTGLDTMRSGVGAALRQNRKTKRLPDDAEREQSMDGGVKPMLVERAVQILCQLALHDAATQELVAERIEDLMEPMEVLAGGVILQAILKKLPDPANPAALHLFARSLPNDQALALKAMSIEPVTIKDPAKAVNEACAAVSHIALTKQLQQTLSALKSPTLTAQERLDLMKKSVDMKGLLNNISPRTL